MNRAALAMVVMLTGVAHADSDGADDDPEDPTDQLPAVTPTTAAGGGTGTALLAEARRELAAVRASHYAHHTHVDETAGLFDFDCSGFVGYALAHAAPDALRALQAASHPRPLAKDFEAVFAAAPATGAPWVRVPHAADLVAGDVIAWLEPADAHSRNTGHVVIAAGPPARRAPGEWTIDIIDSSHSGHGKADARIREHRNGLGEGTIVLLVDADGAPIGYRWSTWSKSRAYHTAVALGRLR